MPSGASSNLCCLFPPNEDRNTETTYATSSMRCSTSRTPGANGVSYPWSSAPGPECGPNFVGGRRTERGAEFSPLCTPRRARRSAERHRDLDGRYRHAPRSRGFERRCDLSQPGRPLRSDQRRQTDRLRRRHGPATLRASRPASTSEASAVEQILDDLARSGADERLELVLVDRALRSRRPSDSRTNSTTKFAEWDGTSPHAMSTGPKSFVHPSRLARRGGPRPSRASATSGALLRRHRDFGHRVVARCLNR